MYDKKVLAVEELRQVLDSVWAYNRLGQVGLLAFYDAAGKELPVASLEVWSGSPPLVVRTEPEAEGGPVFPEMAAADAAGLALAKSLGAKS